MSKQTESQDTVSSVVTLAAQCLMRDAVDLKAQLMTHLDSLEAVQIDAANLERIDAAAMQVLLAFVLDRAKQERNVEWCGVNPVLKEAAQALGLEAALRLPVLAEAA